MENSKDNLKKTTAMNLYLRIFVGGFLLYLACSLGVDLGSLTGKDKVIITAATVLFVVSGVIIIGVSAYRLVKKDYYDPLLDMTEGDLEPSDENEEK
jgi:hypothetical protein